MKKPFFTSKWATVFLQFCETKKALGFDYQTGIVYLLQVDRHLAAPENRDTPFYELIKEWIGKRDNESANTHRVRISPIREFGKYLISIGHPDGFALPKKLCQKQQRPVPHFFTPEEIRKFFAACDTLKPRKENIVRHLVLPMYFRLLYCCGLRTCEARLLKRSDVKPEAGYLEIIHSKGPKDRRVYLSHELVELLRKYDEVVDELMPARVYFFPSTRDTCYGCNAISSNFKKIWQLANIEPSGGPKPRAYDLRHNFAIANINRCVKNGQDPSGLLPYLMLCMGHSTVVSTLYYVHLVPHFLPTVAERVQQLDVLIPEVNENV